MESATIPSARGLPGIGSVFDMARDTRAFLTESYLEHGPVFAMRLLNRRFTVLAGVEANRFLSREGAGHLRSFEFWSGFNAWFGAARSTLSADGPEHAAFRRTLKRGYSRQYAEEHMPGMIDIARREIGSWPLGRSMAAAPALQRIVTDQVGTLVAGVSPRAYNDDLVRYIHGLLSATIVPRPYLRWSPRFRRASARVDRLYHEVIERHSGTMRNRHGAEPDLIDDLLDLHESDPRFFPEADLKIAAMGPFVAALDTVAGTCAFMLYALLRHPDVLERVQAEADALFTGRVPPGEALRGMETMHRAAMETMRMYPVTPLLVRTAANSFEFAGHRIPAGERVMIATAVPHYLPECFPEPERFDIDRYGPETGGAPPALRLRALRPRRPSLPRQRLRRGANRRDHGDHPARGRPHPRPHRLQPEDHPDPPARAGRLLQGPRQGSARGRAAARGTEAVGGAWGRGRERSLGRARSRGCKSRLSLSDAGSPRPAPAQPMRAA